MNRLECGYYFLYFVLNEKDIDLVDRGQTYVGLNAIAC